jgi:hypothetical protein
MDIETQYKINELADQYVDEKLAQGIPFSEELCNWAINTAQNNVIFFN